MEAKGTAWYKLNLASVRTRSTPVLGFTFVKLSSFLYTVMPQPKLLSSNLIVEP